MTRGRRAVPGCAGSVAGRARRPAEIQGAVGRNPVAVYHVQGLMRQVQSLGGNKASFESDRAFFGYELMGWGVGGRVEDGKSER